MKTKKCSKCDAEKTPDQFVRHKQCRDGRASVCKECWRGYFLEWRGRHPSAVQVRPTPPSKACCSCGCERPIDQFVRDKKRPDGRSPRCKTCRLAYYQANRERILKQYAEYQSANAGQLKTQKREYFEKKFFYKRSHGIVFRSGLRGIDSAIEARQLTRKIAWLWKEQRGICPITGRRLTADNAHLDHIIPLKKGGTEEIGNLRWVHRDANYAKRDLLDHDFLQLCLDVVNHFGLQ
jgi:HNH endonuclease